MLACLLLGSHHSLLTGLEQMLLQHCDEVVSTFCLCIGYTSCSIVAVVQAEILPKILHGLQAGADLSLATWREAFEASHRTLDHINKAVTRAEEIFDGHEAQVSGALSEEMTCAEFQCLTWK
jgi:hypothetical protein